MLAVVLGLTAAVQGVELQERHLHANWGKVPDYLTGLGAVAAFGALLIAALEWRQSQAERRDREADQARLIVAALWGVGVTDKFRQFIILRNHSDQPVFTVRIHGVPTGKDRYDGGHGRTEAEYEQAVLSPGDATERHGIADDPPSGKSVAEVVCFSFTDAHGRRWRREGGNQPVRVLLGAGA